MTNRDRAGFDLGFAERAEDLLEPLEQQRPVVGPLILISCANEFADSLPVMFLDLLEKMNVVQVVDPARRLASDSD